MVGAWVVVVTLVVALVVEAWVVVMVSLVVALVVGAWVVVSLSVGA